MACGSCGAALRAGALFCGDCGARVDPRMPLAESAPRPAAWAPPPLITSRPPTSPPVVDGLPTSLFDRSVQRPLPVPRATASSIDEIEATIIAPRRAPMHTIELANGASHPIRTATVIGRSPGRPMSHPDAELLGLVDPSRSLSKSHAVLEPAPEGLVITDLGSTNGIVIVHDDGSETEVAPGRRTLVEPGTRLELGEFVIVVGRA